MTQKDKEVLAAEYVLGTLDSESRQRMDEDLPRDPALRESVDAWEQRLARLDQGIAPVEPPPGLWAKIEAALDKPPAGVDFGSTIYENDGEWEVLLEGVEKKLLFRDLAAKTESYLLRVAPRTRFPGHHHLGSEECLVLEGEFMMGDLRLSAGDYHVANPGSDHPDAWTENGVLVYIRGDMHEAALSD